MAWDALTIGMALRRTAQSFPSREAIVSPDIRLNFANLDALVDEVAAGLLALGIKRGDNLAVWLSNSPEWVAIWIACSRVGAVLVPINTRFKTTEVRYILQQSKACALFMMDSRWDIDFLGMIREILPRLNEEDPTLGDCLELPDLKIIVRTNNLNEAGTITLEQLRKVGRESLGAVSAAEAQVRVNDTVIIVYTSGTTGNPKGAMHTHEMLRNAANVARVMHIEPGDRILGHMPFYHIAGTVTEVLPTILLGCTLVTMPEWNARKALEIISHERVNFFGGIPTHFIDCIDILKSEDHDTSCLKSAWIGGAPVTPNVAEAAFKLMKLDALQAVYGMTETTSSTVMSEFNAPLEILCDNKGRPIGDFEVIVVDSVSGEEKLADEVGEVWVRGHIVMQGYFQNPEATRAVMTNDGFFKTGDLGYFDKQGYLKITGRVKDLFIVGGSNAYPAEIERIIQAHDAVKQVVVVGVPDERLGEVGFAFIQVYNEKLLTENDIRKYCRTAMADYKVPRYFKFVEDFPKTPTGKIQRFLVMEQALSTLTG